MAVVEIFADETYGVMDAVTNVRGAPDYTQARGVRHVAAGAVANGATDSDTSKYRLVALPSSVILSPDTWIDLQNWGYAAATIGIDTDETALLGSTTIVGLSDVTSPIAKNDAKWNKPLWQQLGLASDPGGEITISIHTAAGATGAGSAAFEFHWHGN